MSLNDTTESNMEDNTVNPRSGVTLKNIEVKLPGEFALSEALRDIIAQEQDHEIDLKDSIGLR
jgi:hypothetical protein